MNGLEATAWAYLRERLRDRWQAERLTDRLVKGVPDVVWVRKGSPPLTGFWELKATKAPRGKIPWTSPEQPLWLWRWARSGGTAALVTRSDGRWYVWRPRADVAWVRWIQEGTVDVWAGADLVTDKPEEILEWM